MRTGERLANRSHNATRQLARERLHGDPGRQRGAEREARAADFQQHGVTGVDHIDARAFAHAEGAQSARLISRAGNVDDRCTTSSRTRRQCASARDSGVGL